MKQKDMSRDYSARYGHHNGREARREENCDSRSLEKGLKDNNKRKVRDLNEPRTKDQKVKMFEMMKIFSKTFEGYITEINVLIRNLFKPESRDLNKNSEYVVFQNILKERLPSLFDQLRATQSKFFYDLILDFGKSLPRNQSKSELIQKFLSLEKTLQKQLRDGLEQVKQNTDEFRREQDDQINYQFSKDSARNFRRNHTQQDRKQQQNHHYQLDDKREENLRKHPLSLNNNNHKFDNQRGLKEDKHFEENPYIKDYPLTLPISQSIEEKGGKRGSKNGVDQDLNPPENTHYYRNRVRKGTFDYVKSSESSPRSSNRESEVSAFGQVYEDYLQTLSKKVETELYLNYQLPETDSGQSLFIANLEATRVSGDESFMNQMAQMKEKGEFRTKEEDQTPKFGFGAGNRQQKHDMSLIMRNFSEYKNVDFEAKSKHIIDFDQLKTREKADLVDLNNLALVYRDQAQGGRDERRHDDIQRARDHRFVKGVVGRLDRGRYKKFETFLKKGNFFVIFRSFFNFFEDFLARCLAVIDQESGFVGTWGNGIYYYEIFEQDHSPGKQSGVQDKKNEARANDSKNKAKPKIYVTKVQSKQKSPKSKEN